MVELLRWVASRPRTYAEAIDAWRSSCPRCPVWEDAFADGLLELEGDGPIHQSAVTLTARGKALLERPMGPLEESA
jgi:hypothetical protein